MKFALNYSPQAVQALKAGALAIDLFKCPPWDDLVPAAREHRPAYIHFPLRTSKLDGTDWKAITRWRDSTATPKINIHLAVRRSDIPGIDKMDEEAIADSVEAIFYQDLLELVERFGAENVVAENVPFGRKSRGEKEMLRAAIDPDRITRVLEATGCGLLLDVSHAAITAASLGMEALDYIAALPLERTGEVHVTGIQETEEGLSDHLAFREADFQRVEAALKLMLARGGQPVIMACEYGGVGEKFAWRSEYDVIVRDCARLNTILSDLSRTEHGTNVS